MRVSLGVIQAAGAADRKVCEGVFNEKKQGFQWA